MDIVSLPAEIKDTDLDSRFRLVMAAAHRVRQLNNGARPTVDSKYHKNTSIALEEILMDKMEVTDGEEARNLIASEKSRHDARRMSEASAEDVFVLKRKAEKREEIEAELKHYIDDSSGTDDESDVEGAHDTGDVEDAGETQGDESEEW